MNQLAEAQLHRLDGAQVTLVLLQPSPGAPPLTAYWGRRLPDGLALGSLAALGVRARRQASLDLDPPANALFPVADFGRFGSPAIAGHRQGRSFACQFENWRAAQSAGRLEFLARDAVSELELRIVLELAADCGVLAMQTQLTNLGADAYALDHLAAGVFIAPASVCEALTFSGQWAREFVETRERIGTAQFLKENRRGRTSHDCWPTLFLGPPGFEGQSGETHGFHLGWSGNHRLRVEPLDDGRLSVQLGELFAPGEAILPPGGEMLSPKAYAALSFDGLDGASRNFHHYVRKNIVRWPGGAMRPRPVTLNTWEGNYFQHDLAALKAQASAAAKVGIERFVLDDGWFTGRDDDRRALGDWTVDRKKYPDGLGPLIGHVRALGMEFGLWVEPEMVNEDSGLFRAHPDWALQLPGRARLTGRNQLALDISRPEVADYLFGALDALLRGHAIAYLKWDMNRDLAQGGDAQGRAAYRAQTTALYALLARLRAAHPEVEIETCASGGGRADFGVLAHTHRVWTSDNNDALERVRIQRGFLRLLPPELMGAHISDSPGHQTGRRLTLGFRALAAMGGHFGVEMNPLLLDEAERAELAAWVALHKSLRGLLHSGWSFRFPLRNGRSVHGVVALDRSRALVFVVQETLSLAEQAGAVCVPGLDPAALYRLTLPGPQQLTGHRIASEHQRLLAGKIAIPGALLARVGFNLPDQRPETALLVEVAAVEREEAEGA